MRCPRCGETFEATRLEGRTTCPGCGQELSTRAKLRKTCPECGAPYAVERTTCPVCAANYRLAGLQKQEAAGLTDEQQEATSPARRGCLAAVGIAMTVAGVILFGVARAAGWSPRMLARVLVFLVAGGIAVFFLSLRIDNIAAKARAARHARRGPPPEPPHDHGPRK